MNPEDVWHDVKNAYSERRQVRVSRSEDNGRIRWVIEIERKSGLDDFNTWMKNAVANLAKSQRARQDDWPDAR